MVAVVVSALVSLLAIYIRLQASREQAEAGRIVTRLRETNFDTVIQTNDIKTLGSYLYDTLGAVPLSTYATDEKTKIEVATLVERLERFLDEDLSEDLERDRSGMGLPPSVGSQMLDAEREIYEGEVWNGLARLRRAMEIELRAIAERASPGDAKVRSIRALLDALSRADAIRPEVRQKLEFAANVANRGVHGQPVSRAEAQEAWMAASDALMMLRGQLGFTE